jgi:ParB family transcriptional regulator, chromosome partitioning protein
MSNSTNLIKLNDRKRPSIGPSSSGTPAATFLRAPDVSALQMEIAKIKPNPDQPRQNFNQDKLNKLAESIKNTGVIQPIAVRRDAESGDVILVAGDRRLRASIIAGLKTVPISFINSNKTAEISLIENIQREDLNPIEKAEGMLKMLNKYSYTQDALAASLGMTKSTVSELLSLTRLPDSIKDTIRHADTDTYPARLLIAIARNDNPEEMIDLFDKYNKELLNSEDIRKLSRSKKSKKKAKADISFTPKAIKRQISNTSKYLLGRINKNNIGDVRAAITDLRDILDKLLDIDPTGK